MCSSKINNIVFFFSRFELSFSLNHLRIALGESPLCFVCFADYPPTPLIKPTSQ